MNDIKLFQERVTHWLLECFSQTVATSRRERNFRFVEEALELAQASGLTRADVDLLADYVFSRPVGDTNQEVGGVMVTLSALCWEAELDLNDCAQDELQRIRKPDVMEKIRAKQNAKTAVGVGLVNEVSK